MRAFYNDEHIKELYLARVRQHRAADEIIHGKYWENGRGCAVGCTIHSSDHAAYEGELGIPCALAWLEDRIFENLPNPNAAEWPEAFLSSIPVGADLGHVCDQFMSWLLMDEEAGVIRFAREQDKPAIKQIAALYQRRLAGETITEDEWFAIQSATHSAAYADDADDASLAADYAAIAVGAAINASYNAIVYNTGAAVAAAAERAADAVGSVGSETSRSHIARMAEKLLDLLANAPVGAEQ